MVISVAQRTPRRSLTPPHAMTFDTFLSTAFTADALTVSDPYALEHASGYGEFGCAIQFEGGYWTARYQTPDGERFSTLLGSQEYLDSTLRDAARHLYDYGVSEGAL